MPRADPQSGMSKLPAPTTSAGAPKWLTVAAAVATVAMTAVAFWLSYQHLAEVAAAHSLRGARVRSWAWPATIDLFIVVGELLILRASLTGHLDWWAIVLTVVGSAGSVAFNVAGVGADADAMDYLVAAVPPAAALLAFGALMRQVHAHLTARLPSAPDGSRVQEPSNSTDAGTNRVEAAIRPLYDRLGARPTTSQMTRAMADAGIPHPAPSTARDARKRIEAREPELARLPSLLVLG